MNKLIGFFTLLAISSTAFAAQSPEGPENTPAQKLKIVKNMANGLIKNDIRTQVKLDERGFCGGDGPTYYVDLQVKTTLRHMGQNGVEFKTKWVTVKTYAVDSGELGGSINPSMMDVNECME